MLEARTDHQADRLLSPTQTLTRLPAAAADCKCNTSDTDLVVSAALVTRAIFELV
jgi:hypothetical protein